MKKGFKWMIALSAAAVMVLLLRSFAFTSCLIPSEGMENTLFRGEHILVNKWSYGLRLPFMSLFSYHRWNNKRVSKNDVVVFNNPASTSQPVIDQRKVFISRCIGIPGDTLFIDSLFSVVTSDNSPSPEQKKLYHYPYAKAHQLDSLLTALSITGNRLMGEQDSNYVRSFSRYEYYLLEQAIRGDNWLHPVELDDEKELKPLIVPGKGKVVRVYPWNRTLLCNTLLLHEGKQAEIKNDTLFVNGRATQHCYFTKDYYWMVSNNSVNLSDSRLFGFVPQDHIIGKASFIWFSKETHTEPFKGYRWNRFFQPIQ
ncbi:MAG: signal peptidase I [Bacteroides sp.]|nr:signal peptidase I [Bacteroides sp.]